MPEFGGKAQFTPHPYKGFYVVYEGPEGSGKTTQIRRQVGLLRQIWSDERVIVAREPGGTLIGDEVRSTLLNPKYTNMAYETEIYLFWAARAQLVSQVIRPALEEGKIVVVDRSFISSLAYQGYGREVGWKKIWEIGAYAVKEVVPDMAVFLDIPVEKGLRRKQQDEINRMELDTLEFHRRVRQGFQELSGIMPGIMYPVNAEQSVIGISTQVENEMMWRIGRKMGYLDETDREARELDLRKLAARGAERAWFEGGVPVMCRR